MHKRRGIAWFLAFVVMLSSFNFQGLSVSAEEMQIEEATEGESDPVEEESEDVSEGVSEDVSEDVLEETAEDVEITDDTSTGSTFVVGRLEYEIISDTDKTVKVIDGPGCMDLYEEPLLESLTIPAEVEYEGITYSVLEIGDFAFAAAQYDEWGTPGGVSDVPTNKNYVFSKVVIEEGVKKIGKGAFYQNSIIKEIVLPDSVEEIEEGAFYYYSLRYADDKSGLLTVNIPQKIKKIGAYAYHEVVLPENLVFPDSLISIGEYAFQCNTQLAANVVTIEIPASVQTIKGYAFDILTLSQVAFNKSDPEFYTRIIQNSEEQYNIYMLGQKSDSITIYAPDSALEDYKSNFSKVVPNALFKSITELKPLKENPIKFLYNGNELDGQEEFLVTIGRSKDLTIDKGDAEFSYSDIQWTFKEYSSGYIPEDEVLQEYFTYEDHQNGKLTFTGTNKEGVFVICANVDGYKTATQTLVIIAGSANDQFASEVEKLSAEDIEKMKEIIIYDSDTARKQLSEIKEKAQEITKDCTSDREKIKAIHKWISSHISYDYLSLYYQEEELHETNFGKYYTCPGYVYDIFTNRFSVCGGYSQLAEVMLRSIGIPTAIITGYANGDFYGKRLGHAWNMAYDGEQNEWIIFDSTWDSTGSVEDTLHSGTYEANTNWFDFEKDIAESDREYRDSDLGQPYTFTAFDELPMNYYTIYEGDTFKIPAAEGTVFSLEKSLPGQEKEIVELSDDGTIRALKTGTAVIDTESSDRISSVAIRILEKNPISFKRKNLLIGTEDSNFHLDIVQDNKPIWSFVQFKSSDPSVVSVDEDGFITPKKAGTATITATSRLAEKEQTSCTVTVIEGKCLWSDEEYDYLTLSEPTEEKNGTVEILENHLTTQDDDDGYIVDKHTFPSQVSNGGKNYDVIGLGENALVNPDLTDENVMEGPNWMQYCIQKFELPDKLEYIDEYAFSGVTRIDEISFPASLKQIGYRAFYKASITCDITFPEDSQLEAIGEYAFWGGMECGRWDLGNCGKLKEIGDYAFSGCSEDSSSREFHIILPEGLEIIGENAFAGNKKMYEIEIPSTVKKIKSNAFGRSGLKGTLDISDLKNLEILGDYAFYACDNLETVLLPDNLNIISEGVFGGDGNLSRVVTASAVQEKGGIENISAGSVILSNSIETISVSAFAGCAKIESVEAPGVKNLGEESFRVCSELRKVQFSEELKEIPKGAFESCEKLEDFTFTDSIEKIGAEAFTECNMLGTNNNGEIVLGSGLKEIGDQAFGVSQNGKMKKVTIYSKVLEKVGENIFFNKPTVYIYKSVSKECQDALKACAGEIVYISEPILAEGIVITDEKVNLCVGNTYQLQATVIPEYADTTVVRWSSSNEAVVQVSTDGLLTALKKGTAEITATTVDGTGLEAKCIVTVTQPVNDIHIYYATESDGTQNLADNGRIDVHASNETLYFTVTVDPEDADEKEISWTNSNERTATLEKVSGTENSFVLTHETDKGEEGTTVIRFKATDGYGAESFVTVNYVLKSYTLTIDPANGKTPDVSTVKEKDVLKLPDNPTLKGYVFAGWYLANDESHNILGDPVNINTMIGDGVADAKQEIYVKAKWVLPDEKDIIDINDMLLAEASESGYPAQIYSGKKLTPKVTLKIGQKTLKNNTDYTVTYGDENHNNTDMGLKNGLIYIKGCGQYTGEMKLEFDILGDISKAVVGEYNKNHKLGNFAPRDMKDFSDGSPVELLDDNGKSSVVVQLNKKDLEKDVDYEVVYRSNKEAGTAFVAVVGKGIYTGRKEVAYTIKGIDISKLNFDTIDPVTYTGQKIECLYAADKNSLSADELATADSKMNAYLKQKNGNIHYELIRGTDYVIGYTNNINAGNASVTIAGIGKYTGSKKLTFKILPRNLEGVTGQYEKVQISYKESDHITYTGSAIKPQITVTARVDNDTVIQLVEGVDYKLGYSNNIKQSETTTDGKKKPTITITGNKNFTGKTTSVFEIERADINTAVVDSIPDQKPLKTPKKPEPKPVAMYSGKKLGTADYKLTYSYNEDNTIGTVTINGIGNFAGTKDVNFKIVDQMITDKGITIKVEPKIVYNGSKTDSKPKVTVTKTVGKNKELLYEGADYELIYSQNTDVESKKTVTVKGIGSYGGSKAFTYAITAKNINAQKQQGVYDVVCQTNYDQDRFFYTGNQVKPKVLVVDNTIIVNGSPKVLIENQDYTLKYSNNVAVTKTKDAVISIVGKGNYTGTLKQTVTFKIVAWNFEEQIGNGNVQMNIEDQDYRAKAIQPEVKISVIQPDGTKESLKKGTAFSVSYKNNVNAVDKEAGDIAPTAMIIPNAKNGITGPMQNGNPVPVLKTFTIKPLHLEDAVIKNIAEQTYKGSEINPVPNVKVGKITLQIKKGDFLCEYVKANQKGMATIIIKPGANGNYTGQTEVQFFIK